MTNKRLLTRYSGENAHSYDKVRSSTERFKTEDLAFSDLFSLCKPPTILDCPFGTGRWLPYYKDAERVIGIDISPDMLLQARIKINQMGTTNIQLFVGSIFDTGFLYRLDKSDLVVCTRFLNWYGTKKAIIALQQLISLARSRLIFGITVFPNHLSIGKYISANATIFRRQLRSKVRHRALIYVHNENRIIRFLNSFGWYEVERKVIFSKGDRINCLFLFENNLNCT